MADVRAVIGGKVQTMRPCGCLTCQDDLKGPWLIDSAALDGAHPPNVPPDWVGEDWPQRQAALVQQARALVGKFDRIAEDARALHEPANRPPVGAIPCSVCGHGAALCDCWDDADIGGRKL